MATYTQPRAGSWGPLRAFGSTGYSCLWFANILSYTPRWMQMTLVAWLVLELTDSPWLVALVGFFASTPMLFLGLVGGVLADRTQRKRLIVLLQGMNVAVSLILTLLLASGAIQVWHAYTAICLNGVAWALGFPARRALIFDLLGTSGITNAVALDSVGMNAGRGDQLLLIHGFEDLAKVVNSTEHSDELAHWAPVLGKGLFLGRNNHHERSPSSCQGSVLIPNSRL